MFSVWKCYNQIGEHFILQLQGGVIMKRFKKFGTALLSCMMLTASFATVSNMTMITAEAHPGRTDAQGGHHDYKNKSGLGSYHYHCGDHEAIFIQMESARIRMGRFRMKIRPVRHRRRLRHSPQVIRIR